MAKSKVNELAKDFNMPGKVLVEYLNERFTGPYKTVSAITDEEINYLLERITQENAVDNLNEYFAMQAQAPKRKEAEKAAKEAAEAEKAAKEKAEKAAEKAAEEAAKAEAAAREKAVEEEVKAQKAAQEAAEAEKAAKEAAVRKNNEEHKAVSPAPAERGADDRGGARKQQDNRTTDKKPRPVPGQVHPDAVQPKPMEARKKGPQQQGPTKVIDRSNVRHVDTRGVQVDLSKFDEKLDTFVSDRDAAKLGHGKQKIRQKSKEQHRQQFSHKRETEADKLRRLALEKARKQQLKVMIPDEITVGELASRLKATAAEVIKRLMAMGVMATVNEEIDYDTAALVAMDMNAKVEHEVKVTLEERLIDTQEDADENKVTRAPIVVVMGHVDHGKTSLLDAIRNTNVVSGEAGGITQAIGAYRVKTNGRDITFLDTPGHAAFTAMRARGALMTDIAILVVAADDGIMPQTVEAINHAKAANVSIIVAINKIDKPGADPERVKQGLTEYGLVPEEWGGDVICVPVSAVNHTNIDQLLEMVLLVADMKELKANPARAAMGTVIEARLDKGRGPVATLLVQNGTLHTGDIIIAGTSVGRVRSMTDDRGAKISEAGPAVPVEITGLSEVPGAGDSFNAVADEKMARELVEQRKIKEKNAMFGSVQKVTLDNLFDTMQAGDIKQLSIIVKADVQGSVEAVKQSLEKLSNDEVKVSVIHGAVGAINESDVMLAQTSGAIIVGFNVRPQATAAANADLANVEIRLYRIIYDCIEDVEAAIKGMLAPKIREVVLGKAEVRSTFRVPGVGIVAGAYVQEGKVARNAMIRVVRDGIVIAEDKISSLKRFKDDAKEVAQSYECGIGLEKFNDIKVGDILEAFMLEEYREE